MNTRLKPQALTTGTLFMRAEETSLLSAASAYLELIKPRVTFMVAVTSAAGFYLANTEWAGFSLFIFTLLGTSLLAGGTAVLNQVIELQPDSRMKRTGGRPLPSRRVTSAEALAFAALLIVVGTLILGIRVNLWAAGLGWLTLTLYLVLYTPLKPRTAWCTFLGAFPGAIPPLIGWAGARGQLDMEAFSLFAILFCWQFPHFMAIAWIYNEDYRAGGFKMLPTGDTEGIMTGRVMVFFSLGLLFSSFLPVWWNISGNFYLVAASLLGLAFLAAGLRFAFNPTKPSARLVLRTSILYLPLLLMLMTLDKT